MLPPHPGYYRFLELDFLGKNVGENIKGGCKFLQSDLVVGVKYTDGSKRRICYYRKKRVAYRKKRPHPGNRWELSRDQNIPRHPGPRCNDLLKT